MTNLSYTILLADEDDATRAFLATNLSADGYQVKAAEDRAKAIALLSVDHPDLIIADVNGHTLELLDLVRSGHGLAAHVDPDTPIIVLSERPDDIHRIRVLERGGDDIIAKPFSYPELRARVAAVLRRVESQRRRRQLRVGPLTIDVAARHVRLARQPIELTAKEYELLVALASDPHRVFTREELLRSVWGYRTPSRTVDSHACRLRNKLSAHSQRLVINVWGVGYRLCDPLASTEPSATPVTR
jgi:DNA-binding response OmpR family regulator